MINENILDFRNYGLFYHQLYTRLFDLIDLIIDEKQYNINKIKESTRDFLDLYSYYLIKKKEITKDEKKMSHEDFFTMLKEFNNFTKVLDNYPSISYKKIIVELRSYDYDITKLSPLKFNELLKEYYDFFDDLNIILKEFVDISQVSGFLPNIKSKKSLKTIGYQNTNLFFVRLEDLKVKMTEITSQINANNLFKSRRCMYAVLLIFSPYFSQSKVYNSLVSKLNFSFIEDEEVMSKIQKAYKYKGNIPLAFKEDLDESFMNDLKSNVAIIKRFVSYEFGEIGMSPTINKKYAYDPTGT